MDSLNIHPIVQLIQEEARATAEKLMSGARDRAAAISEYASQRVEEHKEETMARARGEADVLEDRMRRLAMLEVRKDLVAQKRALIEQAFEQAIDRLNATPQERLTAFMADLLVRHAQGTEEVAAGAVNDSFFTDGFLDAANQRLQQMGKPGKLILDDRRVPGVCGLIIKGASSQTHCTFAALMETRRDELEAQVASLLFADSTP